MYASTQSINLHKPQADVYHLMSSPPGLSERSQLHLPKQSQKSMAIKASPFFKPFLIGTMPDKCLPTLTLQ
jgi:hypothetical protein